MIIDLGNCFWMNIGKNILQSVPNSDDEDYLEKRFSFFIYSYFMQNMKVVRFIL